MGHLPYINLKAHNRTRPTIYKLLQDGIIKKEDIMEMLIPKPRKPSTQAEFWKRYNAGDPTVDILGDDGKYPYLVDYWFEPCIYADASATGWGP